MENSSVFRLVKHLLLMPSSLAPCSLRIAIAVFNNSYKIFINISTCSIRVKRKDDGRVVKDFQDNIYAVYTYLNSFCAEWCAQYIYQRQRDSALWTLSLAGSGMIIDFSLHRHSKTEVGKDNERIYFGVPCFTLHSLPGAVTYNERQGENLAHLD